MSFYTYMLHCRGGYFYIGHTDDLDLRMAQHASGYFPGFTRDHLPVKLVWSQDFTTRYEALSVERQIKGWSKAKKMALVRGDWEKISALAKGKGKASTSSAQTEERTGTMETSARPELVEGLSLVCHPDTPCGAVERIEVKVERDANAIGLTFQLFGNLSAIRLPAPEAPTRGANLWEHTCFEAFVMQPGRSDYLEFNFSPSRQWAIYRFDRYREGMRPAADIAVPRLGLPLQNGYFKLAPVIYPQIIGRVMLGLSAVIEESDGTKSYWALAHPPGKPDFHHSDCFALKLAAPSRS